MSEVKVEMISRRAVFSLLGLAAAFGFSVPSTLLTGSDAEAQAPAPAPAPTAAPAPTGGTMGMQRRHERRTGRHERREERRGGGEATPQK